MLNRDAVFKKLFPKGVVVTPPIRHRGAETNPKLREVYLGGAHLGNAMVSYIQQGVNCPLVDMSFTIGIQGRGTLNIPGAELMALLACGNELVRSVAGLADEIVEGEFTEVETAPPSEV